LLIFKNRLQRYYFLVRHPNILAKKCYQFVEKMLSICVILSQIAHFVYFVNDKNKLLSAPKMGRIGQNAGCDMPAF